MDQGPLPASYSLGIDTGGTFTDAVVFSEALGVVGKAKSPTTKHDLSEGIALAASLALKNAVVDAQEISLVSVSTTLATNALVEGHGDRAALVLIGFDEKDLQKSGLADALGKDPFVLLPGGHDVQGNEKPLDCTPLEDFLEGEGAFVSGFAVAGLFATRNSSHELAVKSLLQEKTGLPVTCSHELSSKLGGPKRALTTLLNARLIGINTRLVEATNRFLDERKIRAPLMVVRGDGSLVSAEFASDRPIETILSGPAASLVGARYLTNSTDAIVSDIGGTTTDIAILEAGNPKIDPEGAQVGGYRTMVEAVAMYTYGLGGDSEVQIDEQNKKTRLKLGPKRVVPLSMLATRFPDIVTGILKKQLKTERPGERAGRMVFLKDEQAVPTTGLSETEKLLCDQLSASPKPLDALIQRSSHVPVLDRLVARGIAQISAFTPSDAMHVLGVSQMWDSEAAKIGAELFARKRDRFGDDLAKDEVDISERVRSQLIAQSARYVALSALIDDKTTKPDQHELILELAFANPGATAKFTLGINKPLVGIGASAPIYYPAISESLNIEGSQPLHCEVCNAIGAVVGQVQIRHHVEISSNDGGGSLEVFTDAGVMKFSDEHAAVNFAQDHLKQRLAAQLANAGGTLPDIHIDTQVDAPMIEGRRHFISAVVSGIASGRPAVASSEIES